ncbi:uncharacterized protein LOC125216788 isoform X2 [Salvia hispanica]|uniref:uncharacterized protein LOC125216788 isoform X2 n=1 Tax=Salvia hispanica TaxID=49212 RepID=UPI0020093F10|nr:uncharacterized protein LOC125216788 isoform X2 [Salvia hispanica]
MEKGLKMKLIKRVQCRLKLLKSKRSCIVKQLRRDVAELLKHGHHQLAFERVEQVVVDENMVQVYDLLYQFCEFVIINLSYIRKHRDCPNDINEAASTLIFSSARFGELPELLSIRKLFTSRYGEKFVTSALELLPGHLVSAEIIENLEKKRVPNDVKYKFLDEIAESYTEEQPLFLEYKPQFLENEISDQNHVVELEMREGDDIRIMYEDLLNESKKFWRKSCFGMRKEVDLGNDMETSSEISVKLGEEVIYLDDIEEFIPPVITDSNVQDQRLFVFKSFGADETKSRKSIRKRSRKRSLVQGSLATAYNEFSSYYGESEGSSPEIRRKPRHMRDSGVVLGQPYYDFSIGEVDGDVEVVELTSRHLDKDDVEGRQTLPLTPLRAITMPCERPGESDVMVNIDRSNSCPFNQSPDFYSPHRHIHPKLPDYDELAAKFMELKRAHLEKR